MAHPILMPKPGQMTEECTLIHLAQDRWATPSTGATSCSRSRPTRARWRSRPSTRASSSRRSRPRARPSRSTASAAGSASRARRSRDADRGAVSGRRARRRLPRPSRRPPAPGSAPAPTSPAPPAARGSGARSAAGDVRISPRARRLAAEAGHRPVLGPRHRAPTAGSSSATSQAAIAAGPRRAAAPRQLRRRGIQRVHAGEEAPRPMSRMRRVIAERLTSSWQTTPHFTVTVAVDVTRLLALRARAQGRRLEPHGHRLRPGRHRRHPRRVPGRQRAHGRHVGLAARTASTWAWPCPCPTASWCR